MRSVKINKKELLKIVRENKDKHAADFLESVNDYKSAAIKVAQEHVELAKTGELDKIAKIKAMRKNMIVPFVCSSSALIKKSSSKKIFSIS